jgi:hypothetical protein
MEKKLIVMCLIMACILVTTNIAQSAIVKYENLNILLEYPSYLGIDIDGGTYSIEDDFRNFSSNDTYEYQLRNWSAPDLIQEASPTFSSATVACDNYVAISASYGDVIDSNYSTSWTWGYLSAWENGERKCAAIRMISGTNTYYGYIDMEYSSADKEFIVYGWAYNDTPDAAITVVPEPATMVIFGLGGLMLNITRRRSA